MGKLTETFEQVRKASRTLAFCDEKKINGVLLAVADATEKQTGKILADNVEDLARMEKANPK